MNAAQVAAIARHILTFLGGMITCASLLHFISVDEAKKIGASLTDISNGVASISVALGGLIATISGIWAAYKQSHVQQIKSVNAIDGVKVTNENAPGAVITTPPPAKIA
jgi:hypothetical protein